MNPRASGLATVAILFLVLSLFLVALRCYVRAHLIKGFGADDTTMVITMVSKGPKMGQVESADMC